jgi:hypothetical protein
VDEAYVLLMTEINDSILHWEEQGWIAGNCGIVDAHAGRVMEQDDGRILETKPRGVKEATSIVHQAIDYRAAVQLGAHRLKNEMCINKESLKSTLGDLKSVCTLKNGHAWLDLGINRCRQASDLDRNKVLGDKQHFVHLHGIGVEGEVIASSSVDGAPLKTTHV